MADDKKPRDFDDFINDNGALIGALMGIAAIIAAVWVVGGDIIHVIINLF